MLPNHIVDLNKMLSPGTVVVPGARYRKAPVAQSVERLICNQNVAGSIPARGSKEPLAVLYAPG